MGMLRFLVKIVLAKEVIGGGSSVDWVCLRVANNTIPESLHKLRMELQLR